MVYGEISRHQRGKRNLFFSLSKGRKKIKRRPHKECGGTGRANEETALKTSRDDGGGSEREEMPRGRPRHNLHLSVDHS